MATAPRCLCSNPWSPRSRGGSKILAEFAGYGTTNDAGDLLRPDRDGAARSMRMALDHGRLEPTQIGYVNAHGTGTIANDLNETLALRDVFGDRFAEMLVSSTKPIHGHALGAGGALELLITLKALEEQVAPPTHQLRRDGSEARI